MRLTRLHLAGFKSFASPTDVLFPSPLVAIVGPNGCGKSNLIDAVRWVLGESSARNLRGQSLDDVIFAGGGDRPAASQATVTLDFDNSEGRLAGPFAGYNQISIRRELGRDGQSRYFINKTRVRRRDITDLFLGTGVGARSYSVIEQGQVNRIIDAKPEDLRAYLEEAAGISVYRERRRETETRIRHTRENLERLNDLATELARQQASLERQARAAEKYARLRGAWRTVLVEQAGLNQALAERALAAAEGERSEREAARTAAETALRAAQAEAQETQIAQARASESFRSIQSEHYRLRGDLAQVTARAGEVAARIESIEQQQLEDRATRQRLEESIQALVAEQAELRRQQQETETRRTEQREQAVEARSSLRFEEDRLQQVRQQWREAVEALTEPQQARAHAEAERRSVERQLERLEREERQTAGTDFEPQIAELEARREALSGRRAELEAQREDLNRRQGAFERAQAESQAEYDHCRQQADVERQARDALRAEQTGLERLLQSPEKKQGALSGDDAEAPRLLDLLVREAGQSPAQIDDWWGHVLGDCIEARCVDDLEALVARWDQDERPAHGCWVSAHGGEGEGVEPWLADWRASRRRMETLAEALACRHELQPGHCFVLPDGWRVGSHWIARPNRDTAATQLSQRLRLNRLEAELGERAASCDAAVEAAKAVHQRLSEADDALRQIRQALQRVEQELARLDIDRHDLDRQHQRILDRRAEWQSAQTARGEDQRRLKEELATLTKTLAEREAVVQALTAARDAMVETQQTAELAVQERRRASGQASARLNEIERKQDQQRHRLIQIEQIEVRDREQIRAMDERLARFEERLDTLAGDRETLRADQQSRQADIDTLAERERVAAAALEAVEVEVHRHATRVAEAQATLERAKEAVQSAELAVIQARVHGEHIDSAFGQALRQWLDGQAATTPTADELAGESVGESGPADEDSAEDGSAAPERAVVESEYDSARIEALLEPVLRPLLDELDACPGKEPGAVKALQARIEERRVGLERQIERLGAVNLTAIEAHAEVSARKAELDGQMADVNEALERLESAMRTMDRETRQRFRQVFEDVNARLGPRFNQLFGGGEARLELTEADELVAGVSLFARPPGKKVTHLSLLSGGEKALTAVALIFAIFELNPAPFCILDEIDAPLDEANVGRFCDMVSSMSDRVQFIYITHNKATMASASALVGVTMREAGVSRIVSVDIDRALALAEANA